jgi:hypothetical protein
MPTTELKFKVVLCLLLIKVLLDGRNDFKEASEDWNITRHVQQHSTSSERTPKKVFGHLHIAKTGGTTVNGLLALNYERVCGHKGYSYDFALVNAQPNRNDSYQMAGEIFNRGRVPWHIMDEIGYENCDYISNEIDWQWWERTQKTTFSPWNMSIELHVPCRDPIDHLMSQCNFKSHVFNCNGDIARQVEKCNVGMRYRFSAQLLDTFPSVKCFEAHKIDEYMVYMGKRLEAKSIPFEYNHRDTNSPRRKESECIWKNTRVRKKTLAYLLSNFDLMRFCSNCLNSTCDLLNEDSQI